MKEIVPYTEAELKLLKLIGRDMADDIPDQHEKEAEFVISRSVQYDGYEGKYTGWMLQGKMHGKGRLVSKMWGGSRYDGLWKDHTMHGKGRLMRYNGAYAYQGMWANDKRSSPMTEYFASGEVKKLL